MSRDSDRWEGWSHVRKYIEEVPLELRERAVRMVGENVGQHESEWAAMGEVAGVSALGVDGGLIASDS